MKRELDALLNVLPIAQTLEVVRAFSYFSHLVNIAEDVHQNRRRRAHALAGSPPQNGSIARALERIAAGGHGRRRRCVRWFADALVSPVLTAHPTEVQRRSILDCEREIVRLLQWRDRVEFTPDEVAEFESGLYRQVLALWQTAMLRLSKLRVADEIENGLAFYRYTFLTEIPKIYAALEHALRRDFALAPRCAAAAVPAHGLVDRRRSRRQSECRRRNARPRDRRAGDGCIFLLSGTDPSAWRRAVVVGAVGHATPELLALAAAAHDANPHRKDEPYRQALVGIYSRAAATAAALAGVVPPLAPQATASALRDARRIARRSRDDSRIRWWATVRSCSPPAGSIP